MGKLKYTDLPNRYKWELNPIDSNGKREGYQTIDTNTGEVAGKEKFMRDIIKATDLKNSGWKGHLIFAQK